MKCKIKTDKPLWTGRSPYTIPLACWSYHTMRISIWVEGGRVERREFSDFTGMSPKPEWDLVCSGEMT